MSLAVDKYMDLAAARRNDGRIELVSTAFPNAEKFPFDRIEKNPSATWADYVKGVLLQLRQHGVHFTGCNIAIHGTIPLGGGMSSSAALEIATALIVRQLFPFRVTPTGMTMLPHGETLGQPSALDRAERMFLAKLCRSAESEFVGVHCGLLDQISILFGKASHLVQIDCRHVTVEHQPLPADIAVIVCDSGVKHDLADGEYNRLHAECESAARALGVSSLRSVNPQQLKMNQDKMTPRELECARHIVEENQRVVFGERSLREGDVEQFGEYLFQSHASSRDLFKNSCPELDLLVELARSSLACLGARLTGGGFGGATINLVRQSAVSNFSQMIAAQYQQQTGRTCRVWCCQVVDGA